MGYKTNWFTDSLRWDDDHLNSHPPFTATKVNLNFTKRPTQQEQTAFIFDRIVTQNINSSKSFQPFDIRSLSPDEFTQKAQLKTTLDQTATQLETDLLKSGILLHRDPLTIKEQLRIQEFMTLLFYKLEPNKKYSYLETQSLIPKKFTSNTSLRISVVTKIENCIKNRKKFSTELDDIAKVPFEGDDTEKQVIHFLSVIKNPSLLVDNASHAQLFATKVFMKAYLKDPLQGSFKEVYQRYRKKMGNDRLHQGLGISCKNSLLMKNQPLKPLSKKGKPSSLDLVLANCYCQSDDMIVHIRTESILTKLSQEPHLKHIFDVLGSLIQNEKAQFFFSVDERRLGMMGTPYGVETGLSGCYLKNRSILCTSFVTSDYALNPTSIGTFIHEVIHMILERVIENNALPCKAKSSDEEIFFIALLKDITILETASKNDLKTNRDKILHRLLSDLKESLVYFDGQLFDKTNITHLKKFGVEFVARMMEAITLGQEPEKKQKTEREFQLFVPNTWHFYHEYTKPMLKQYVEKISWN